MAIPHTKPLRTDAEVLAAAKHLARGPLAERAAAYDEEGRFPFENYRDLHRAGLVGLVVPREHGGLEASWPLYAAVLRTLARACGSTALTFNMHSSIARIVAALGTEEQKAEILGDVTRDGALLASITSEPGSSLRGKFAFRTVALRVEGGLRVSGFKHFCSLAHGAKYYFVWAILEDTKTVQDGLVNLIIPSDSEGLTILDTWNTMSLRATDSQSLKLEEVFVPAGWQIGKPGEVVERGLTDVFMLGYAAVYLGIGEGAYAFTREYAMTKVFEPDPHPISHHPSVQSQIADMALKLKAARLLLEDAAREAEVEAPGERGPALAQAKWLCTETARAVTASCLDIVGGRGISKGFPLERMIRDAHAGVVMPPNTDNCREVVGKSELGLPVPVGFLR